MTDILNEIVARRRMDIGAKTVPLAELKAKHADRADFRPFRQSLRQNMKKPGRAAIIAEIKRGSPAKGLFAPNLEPAKQAKIYGNDAACLSVLTEPHWFFGSLDDLITARNACKLPVLQKDFVVTEYQVWEAAVHADCMLLIARCLERQQLADFYGLATELGLDVLVEVFDEKDIEKIEPFHFPLVGINHRNLRTMSIDIERSHRLLSRFASDQTIVAASGIRNRDDIESLMRTGIHAFLVGESLSTHEKPAGFIQKLVVGNRENHRLVKICGITSPEVAIACFEAGADMIGLVHYPPSPRHINVTQMGEILDAVKPLGQTVLVVVDQLPEKIDRRISYLQVYGEIRSDERKIDENPRQRIHVVKNDETFIRLLDESTEADTFSYYCLEMTAGKLPGGNGAAWDWSIAKPFCERFPTFIAGGITPENVADAIRCANPCGVDVSSGVESAPGIKDMDKVKRLIENVRKMAHSCTPHFTESDKAVSLFSAVPKEYNCAQSVARAFGRDDVVALLKLCGGGRAEGGLCGALYAALRLLPEDKWNIAKERFHNMAGNVLCRTIRREGKTSCTECVRIAADLVAESPWHS